MGSVGFTFPRQWGSLWGEKTRTELGPGSGPVFGNDILYVAFTENGNEISCFTTLISALAYSEVDKIMSVLF